MLPSSTIIVPQPEKDIDGCQQTVVHSDLRVTIRLRSQHLRVIQQVSILPILQQVIQSNLGFVGPVALDVDVEKYGNTYGNTYGEVSLNSKMVFQSYGCV